MGYFSWTPILHLIIGIVSTTAMVFIAIGVARVAKVLESMNITTMDVAETAKRIEKTRQGM
ncbi:MAG: hypothetical protein ACYS9X_09605 [Planctomycetota bacterium]